MPGMNDLNQRPEGAEPADPDHMQNAVHLPHQTQTRRTRTGAFVYGDPDFSGSDEAFITFYRNQIEDADYIRKDYPGDKFFQPDREVRERDIEMYPHKWALYKRSEDQLTGQTPLRNVTYMDDAMRARLAESRIFTEEQLASLPDTNLEKLGFGIRKMRDRAIASIKGRSPDANAQVLELRKQLAELTATVNQQKAAAGKGKAA